MVLAQISGPKTPALLWDQHIDGFSGLAGMRFARD